VAKASTVGQTTQRSAGVSIDCRRTLQDLTKLLPFDGNRAKGRPRKR